MAEKAFYIFYLSFCFVFFNVEISSQVTVERERRCSFGVTKMVICFTVIILRHLNKRRVIILCCFKKKKVSFQL